MDEVERDRLIKALEEFDASDDYHADRASWDEPGYYAAIDRAIALIRGDITTWTDLKKS